MPSRELHGRYRGAVAPGELRLPRLPHPPPPPPSFPPLPPIDPPGGGPTRDFTQLLDDVGGRMASVAKGRIEETKAGPDGTPWPAWSPKYAKGRRSGASLLFDEDNLRFDIHHVVEGNRLEVGSNIPYAGVHQHGSKQATGRGGGIPARPYLGMSAEDEADIVLLAQDFLV